MSQTTNRESNFRFDLDTNCWQCIDTSNNIDEASSCPEAAHSSNGKPQRPHPRSQSFIFVRQGCLYVYGGYDGHSVLADMYKLDLSTRTWSLIWASKFSYGCGGSPVGVGGLRPVDFRIHPCRPAAVIGNWDFSFIRCKCFTQPNFLKIV